MPVRITHLGGRRRSSAAYRPPEGAKVAVSLELGVTKAAMRQSGRGRRRGCHGALGTNDRPNSPERAANSSGHGRPRGCHGGPGIGEKLAKILASEDDQKSGTKNRTRSQNRMVCHFGRKKE